MSISMKTSIRCSACGITIGLTESLIKAIKDNPEEVKKAAAAGLECAKLLGGEVYNIFSFIEKTYMRFMPTKGMIDEPLEAIANGADFACPRCNAVKFWAAYSKFSGPLAISIGLLEHLMGLLHKLMGETLEQLAQLEEQLVEKDKKSDGSGGDLIVERKSLWCKVIDLNTRLKEMAESRATLLQKLNIVESVLLAWDPCEIYKTLESEKTVTSIVVNKKLRIELANVLKNLAKVERDFAKIVEFVKKAEFKEDDKEAQDAKQADYSTTMNERAFCHIHLMVLKKQLEELRPITDNHNARA